MALIIVGAVLALGFALTALVFVPLADRHLQEPTSIAQAYGELEARGYAVYQREGCVYCHSQQVRSLPVDRPFGTRASQPGDYALENPAPLGRVRVGADLRYVGDRHDSIDWYVEFLSNPHHVVANAYMPSYGHLPADELRALAAYLASRAGGYEEMPDLPGPAEPVSPFAPVPAAFASLTNPVARTAEVLAAGQERFNSYCASCHGMAGDGKGAASMGMNPPPADFTRPIYQDADDAYLYWRISEGVPGTMMPAWNSVFSEEQMWELVHYLREFHK